MKFKINKYNNNLLLLTLLLLIIFIITTYSINFNIIDTFTNNDTKNMKSYSVIFAGAIKNGEKYIKNNLDNIDKCGKKFKNYAVIIYENDSSDNTRNILNDNKKLNYYYIFEDGIKEHRRTMRISNGRNKILSKIREINKDNYYNYMIMLDLDNVNKTGKFVETIDTCFDYDIEEWDVLTGNQSDFYYDLWALRKKYDMEIDCWKKIKLPDGTEQKYYNTFLIHYAVKHNVT
jgi:ABC-type sugar transport system permease subunit